MSSIAARRARLLGVSACIAVAIPLAGQTRDAAPSYALTAVVPLGMQGYSDLDHDPVTGRVLLALREGLRVLDTRTGRIGPHLTALETSGAIEIAPDIRRAFAEIDDDYVGFIDLDSLGLDRLQRVSYPGTLMYAPDTEELYVFSDRVSEVVVFDGRSGDRKLAIPLPGWGGVAVLRAPGRIYATVMPRDDMYVIDTGEKRVTRFPLPRGIDLPKDRFTLVADAAGRTLFAADDYEVFAVDATTGEQIARIQARVDSLLYDEEARVLLAWLREIVDWPHVKLVSFRLDARRLLRVSEQNLPAEAGRLPHGTASGFVAGFATGVPATTDRALPVPSRKYVSVWTRDATVR
jgi:DNA-binding beta-propeller fold protein YncE